MYNFVSNISKKINQSWKDTSKKVLSKQQKELETDNASPAPTDQKRKHDGNFGNEEKSLREMVIY